MKVDAKKEVRIRKRKRKYGKKLNGRDGAS